MLQGGAADLHLAQRESVRAGERLQMREPGFSDLTALTYLSLSHTKVTDGVMLYLKGPTRLSFLDFSGTRITDAGLAYLRGCSNLRHRYLRDKRRARPFRFAFPGVVRLRAAEDESRRTGPRRRKPARRRVLAADACTPPTTSEFRGGARAIVRIDRDRHVGSGQRMSRPSP
jgi:hypothetical protein